MCTHVTRCLGEWKEGRCMHCWNVQGMDGWMDKQAIIVGFNDSMGGSIDECVGRETGSQRELFPASDIICLPEDFPQTPCAPRQVCVIFPFPRTPAFALRRTRTPIHPHQRRDGRAADEVDSAKGGPCWVCGVGHVGDRQQKSRSHRHRYRQQYPHEIIASLLRLHSPLHGTWEPTPQQQPGPPPAQQPTMLVAGAHSDHRIHGILK
eukprot:gene10377-biopygen3289